MPEYKNEFGRFENEFGDLVEYLIERCLEAADDGDKDRFVRRLIDFRDVVDDYIEQRANLGKKVNASNSESLERLFSDHFVNLYRELINEDAPSGFRTEILSAIVTTVRRARKSELSSTYEEFLSTLNRCYRIEVETVDNFRTKRFLVRRYNLIISTSIEELQESNSQEELDSSQAIWVKTFEQTREILKLAVEFSDNEIYSQITSELMDFHHYDIVSSANRGLVDPQDGDNEFLEQKSELGREIESQISVLLFVLTGWAFRLLRNGTLSREDYTEIAGATESQRNSLADIAEIYYEGIRGEGTGGMGYWERWDMEEAMEETMGVATTSMAALSWLQEFYCVELLRLGSQSLDGDDFDTEENPIPASKIIVNESDQIREVTESLNEDSIAESIIGHESELDIESLIDAVVRLHEKAEKQYREGVRQEVHSSLPEEEKKDSFKDSIQSNFVENCTLRNVLRNISIISEGPTDEEGEMHELGRFRVPRRKFVSVDDIPLHLSIQKYTNPIQNKYQKLLFENLEITRESVDSQDELIDRVRDYIDSRDVEAILTRFGTINDVFRDADDYQYALTSEERIFENQRGSFAETPVLSMRGDEFSILLLYPGPTQVVESNPADEPLSIEMEPAEDTLSTEDKEDLSEEELENIKDWVYAYISYPCRFRQGSTLGVAITLENE